MARQILPLAGQIIGGMIGGPVGAAIGSAIGGAVGAYVDPMRHQGPKLGEARAQTAQEGVYRPLVFGTGAVAGNVIHRSPRKVVRHRESVGKGSRDTIDSDRGYRTFAIRIAEAHTPEGYQLLRIWENETLVYDVRPESEIVAESEEYAEKFRFYPGTQDQLPDPDLEAYMGVGNVNSYRGSCYIVFGNFDLTDYGDMVPQYRFEIASAYQDRIGDAVSASYEMPGLGDSSYMYANSQGIHFASGVSVVNVGNSYHKGLLDHDLEEIEIFPITWNGFGGDSRPLNIRASFPNGLGVSADGSGGLCLSFSGSGGSGRYQPQDTELEGWWYAEDHYLPEYGGLIWPGDSSGGEGYWYLGVRRTGPSGQYRNRLIKFPMAPADPALSVSIKTGIGETDLLWMHRSNDGIIHVIEFGGGLQEVRPKLG